MSTNKISQKPKQKKADVEASLIRQLEAKNAKIPHFLDMISDYMSLWTLKNKLQADIRRRGVSYTTKSSSGVDIVKQNQSVKDLVAVNKQMLSLLDRLGLTTDAPTGEIDEDNTGL